MSAKNEGLETIKGIAEGMVTPAPVATEEEKQAAEKAIAEGAHEPDKSKPEDFKIGSVPRPPDDPNGGGGDDGQARKKTRKRGKKKMADKDRKRAKKEEQADGTKPRREAGGGAPKPVPGGEKKPEPKPKRDFGPLI